MLPVVVIAGRPNDVIVPREAARESLRQSKRSGGP
jgi:hypothetical protein